MPTFNDFHQWLFPGDPVQNRYRNPSHIPEEVVPLLEEISRCTHVPMKWLENAAGRVVDGMAGLRCLWYLHGLHGTVMAEGSNLPDEAFVHELATLRNKAKSALIQQYGGQSTPFIVAHWDTGIVEEKYYDPKDSMKEDVILPRIRKTKLGKWLKKHGASAELMHAFETREMPVWEWEISCHPYDILTMSYDRPWTSCMRPGGEYEFGPLTDMAAGSALMFFKRPGAAVPCGRRILRPGIINAYTSRPRPRIFDGGRTYGCGPTGGAELTTVLNELIETSSGIDIPITYKPLCQRGVESNALTRHIYSDTDHTSCGQTDSQYAEAYDALSRAQWPDPKLDMGEWQSLAEAFRGQIEFDEDESASGDFEWDIEDLQGRAWDYINETISPINALYLLAEPTALDEKISYGIEQSVYAIQTDQEIPGHIMSDIYEYVRMEIKEYVNDQVRNAMLDIYIVPDDVVGYDATKSKARAEFQNNEYNNSMAKWSVRSMRDHALGNFEEEVYKILKQHVDFSDDVSLNDRVVVIPRAFAGMFPNLAAAAAVHVEVEPSEVMEGDWI